jgi:hypothetical protein
VPGTLTVRGCPAAKDGLDGELARLQDQGTGGMAPLSTPYASAGPKVLRSCEAATSELRDYIPIWEPAVCQSQRQATEDHQRLTARKKATSLAWAGRGWRTSGDALLALSAAARAREYRRVAREESALVP